MARLWSSGFELNSLSAGVEIEATSIAGGGAVSISSSIFRSGSYSLRSVNTGASGGAFVRQSFAAVNSNGPYYARAYIYTTARPTAICSVLNLIDTTNIAKARIRMAADGSLELWDTAAKFGSSSGVLALNTWYMIEIKAFNNTGTGRLELDARLEGVSFATGSSTNTGGLAKVDVGFSTATTSFDGYFDDIAVNDSTGTAQNSWPGSGAIVHMHPDSAGDFTQWTAGAGGTANWNRVSEVSPDDLTTYNKRAATGTFIDDFNVQSSLSAGIPAGSTISVVSVGARVGSTSTTATGRTGSLRLKGQASGTVTTSTAAGWNVNGWTTNAIAVPKNYPLVSYTNPQTGTAWTTTTLDTMQIGYTNGSSSANEIRVSTLWAQVEYISASLQTLTKAHTTDANKKGTGTIFHTTDSLKRATTTKFHTTDASIKRSPTVFHTSDANKKGTLTVFHTADGLKRLANTKSHTTDSLKRLAQALTFTTDALLRTSSTKTHTTDSLLRLEVPKTHTTDSYLLRTPTLTFTTDTLLNQPATKTHTTDANRHIEDTKTHTTSSYLSSALQTLTTEHTTDTLLRGTGTTSHTTSAVLKFSFSPNFSTDALLRIVPTLTHTTDALKYVSPTLTHTSDTLLRASLELFYTTDTLLRLGATTTHTADAYLFKPQTFLINHLADANLEAEYLGAWSEVWDFVVTEYLLNHTTDASKRSELILSHTTDANKKGVVSVYHTTDSLLRKVFTVSHSADAIIAATSELSHTTDANLLLSVSISHLADANLRKTSVTISHTTSSALNIPADVSHTTDALLKDPNFTSMLLMGEI